MSNNIFENVRTFNVDTFDNCLSDVHCHITLSLHADNTNPIPNNFQPHDDEVTDSSEGAPAINMSFKWSLDKANEFQRNISGSDLEMLSCELESVKLLTRVRKTLINFVISYVVYSLKLLKK